MRCCDLGTEHLTVVDLDVDRATVLARELAGRHRGARVDASAFDKLSVLLPVSDGVVHCTPTGMADHPGMPFDAALLHPQHVGGRHRLSPSGHRTTDRGA